MKLAGCKNALTFSFDRMFLKLGNDVDIDEILKKFENWPDRIINLRVTFP